jgi:hypothetical protein
MNLVGTRLKREAELHAQNMKESGK